MVHVVSYHNKRACLTLHPGACSEKGNLGVPPVSSQYLILLLDLCVLTKIKLENEKKIDRKVGRRLK